jgi:hypothetical protein
MAKGHKQPQSLVAQSAKKKKRETTIIGVMFQKWLFFTLMLSPVFFISYQAGMLDFEKSEFDIISYTAVVLNCWFCGISLFQKGGIELDVPQ